MVDGLRAQLRTRRSEQSERARTGEQLIAEGQAALQQGRHSLERARAAEAEERSWAEQRAAEHASRRAAITAAIQTAATNIRELEQKGTESEQRLQRRRQQQQQQRDSLRNRMELATVSRSIATDSPTCAAYSLSLLCAGPSCTQRCSASPRSVQRRA